MVMKGAWGLPEGTQWHLGSTAERRHRCHHCRGTIPAGVPHHRVVTPGGVRRLHAWPCRRRGKAAWVGWLGKAAEYLYLWAVCALLVFLCLLLAGWRLW